jgi:hypothetical protein
LRVCHTFRRGRGLRHELFRDGRCHDRPPRTQVYEGQVKVRERASGKVISLTQGQTNSTAGSLKGSEPTIIGPPGHSPDWIELETTMAPYVGQAHVAHPTSGRVEMHRCEILLLQNGTVHRKACLG